MAWAGLEVEDVCALCVFARHLASSYVATLDIFYAVPSSPDHDELFQTVKAS